MPPLTEGGVELYYVCFPPLTRTRSSGQPCNGSGADIDDHPKVCIRVQEGSWLRNADAAPTMLTIYVCPVVDPSGMFLRHARD